MSAAIAPKIGCIPQTLREGVTTDERDWGKSLEWENRVLRQSNEILSKASAYFAQAEVYRPLKS